jgi:uncharacterized membrane protein
VTDGGRPSVRAAFPTDAGVEVEVPPLDTGVLLVNRTRVGVIQAIDRTGLVELAGKAGMVLDVLVETGEYVGVGTPVARVVEGDPASVQGDDVTARFLLGSERTLLHDPGFVFRQLVDIAIRALSPAVNDPTTAVQAIDRINDLLGDIATSPDPSGWYVDLDDVPRVHLREPGVERLIVLAYTEIIRYGADSPQVVRRLRAAFEVLARQVRPDLVAVLDALSAMLEEARATALPAAFRDVAAVADRHGLG